jgi:hypothetical protein
MSRHKPQARCSACSPVACFFLPIIYLPSRLSARPFAGYHKYMPAGPHTAASPFGGHQKDLPAGLSTIPTVRPPPVSQIMCWPSHSPCTCSRPPNRPSQRPASRPAYHAHCPPPACPHSPLQHLCHLASCVSVYLTCLLVGSGATIRGIAIVYLLLC